MVVIVKYYKNLNLNFINYLEIRCFIICLIIVLLLISLVRFFKLHESKPSQRNRRKKKRSGIRKKNRKRNRNKLSDYDDILVYEILTRLPVKSLTRFKCVCKRWRSLIEKDSEFIDLHFTHSKKHPILFVALIEPLDYSTLDDDDYDDEGDLRSWISESIPPYCFLTADLFESRGRLVETATIHNINKMSPSSFPKKNLRPVHGLICLLNMPPSENKLNFCFRIYNVGTRKSTPWIKSPTLLKQDYEQSARITYTFQFGVSLITKEQKVICVWVIPREEILDSGVVCQVLTIGGEGTWRRIDEVLTRYVPCGDSLYVNGSIYWSEWWIKKGNIPGDQPEVVIVAFDVENEKFRTIQVPKFIVNQIHVYHKCYPHSYLYYCLGVSLLEVDGHLALLGCIKDHSVKLWILEDDDEDYKNVQKSTSISRNKSWTEVTIKLPSHWDLESLFSYIRFKPIAGTTDEILLHVHKDRSEFFYFYSLKKKTLAEFKISNIPSSFDLSGSMLTTFTESLFPIKDEAAPSHP